MHPGGNEMSCPYCGGTDWIEHEPINQDIEEQYVRVAWACYCPDCGRWFVTDEWYNVDSRAMECRLPTKGEKAALDAEAKESYRRK